MTRSILIVDDDAAERATFAAILAAAGYAVSQAGGAYEAMRAVLRAPPDLAIIDLVLPDVRGMDVTRAIHAIAGATRLPVIAVTGSPRSVAGLEARVFGAECILLKPVDAAELLGAVERCIAASAGGGG